MSRNTRTTSFSNQKKFAIWAPGSTQSHILPVPSNTKFQIACHIISFSYNHADMYNSMGCTRHTDSQCVCLNVWTRKCKWECIMTENKVNINLKSVWFFCALGEKSLWHLFNLSPTSLTCTHTDVPRINDDSQVHRSAPWTWWWTYLPPENFLLRHLVAKFPPAARSCWIMLNPKIMLETCVHGNMLDKSTKVQDSGFSRVSILRGQLVKDMSSYSEDAKIKNT